MSKPLLAGKGHKVELEGKRDRIEMEGNNTQLTPTRTNFQTAFHVNGASTDAERGVRLGEV